MAYRSYHRNLQDLYLQCPGALIVDYIYAGLHMEDQAQSLLDVFAGNPTNADRRDINIRCTISYEQDGTIQT